MNANNLVFGLILLVVLSLLLGGCAGKTVSLLTEEDIQHCEQEADARQIAAQHRANFIKICLEVTETRRKEGRE